MYRTGAVLTSTVESYVTHPPCVCCSASCLLATPAPTSCCCKPLPPPPFGTVGPLPPLTQFAVICCLLTQTPLDAKDNIVAAWLVVGCQLGQRLTIPPQGCDSVFYHFVLLCFSCSLPTNSKPVLLCPAELPQFHLKNHRKSNYCLPLASTDLHTGWEFRQQFPRGEAVETVYSFLVNPSGQSFDAHWRQECVGCGLKLDVMKARGRPWNTGLTCSLRFTCWHWTPYLYWWHTHINILGLPQHSLLKWYPKLQFTEKKRDILSLGILFTDLVTYNYPQNENGVALSLFVKRMVNAR